MPDEVVSAARRTSGHGPPSRVADARWPEVTARQIEPVCSHNLHKLDCAGDQVFNFCQRRFHIDAR